MEDLLERDGLLDVDVVAAAAGGVGAGAGGTSMTIIFCDLKC